MNIKTETVGLLVLAFTLAAAAPAAVAAEAPAGEACDVAIGKLQYVGRILQTGEWASPTAGDPSVRMAPRKLSGSGSPMGTTYEIAPLLANSSLSTASLGEETDDNIVPFDGAADTLDPYGFDLGTTPQVTETWTSNGGDVYTIDITIISLEGNDLFPSGFSIGGLTANVAVLGIGFFSGWDKLDWTPQHAVTDAALTFRSGSTIEAQFDWDDLESNFSSPSDWLGDFAVGVTGIVGDGVNRIDMQIVIDQSGSGGAGCAPSQTNMCLNNDRFKVELAWRNNQGETGEGMVVQFGTDDSGLFYFFNEDNWEMLVKVLDGCTVNNHYWVFSAAATNVEYTLTVTDTQTETVRTYFNPLGTSAPAITDTTAFATCATPSEIPVDILLVDDDWDFTDDWPDSLGGLPYYEGALNALGLSYDVWDVIAVEAWPGPDTLAEYDVVIWWTGYAWQGDVFGETEEEIVAEYLDDGGNFILSSQEYVFDAGSVTDFMRDYLGVQSVNEDVDKRTVQGIGGDDIGDGLGPYDLVRPDAQATYWPTGDNEGLYNDDAWATSSAAESFEYPGLNPVPCATYKDGGTYKTAYFGFPLEWIGPDADRAEVLGAVLAWMTAAP